MHAVGAIEVFAEILRERDDTPGCFFRIVGISCIIPQYTPKEDDTMGELFLLKSFFMVKAFQPIAKHTHKRL